MATRLLGPHAHAGRVTSLVISGSGFLGATFCVVVVCEEEVWAMAGFTCEGCEGDCDACGSEFFTSGFLTSVDSFFAFSTISFSASLSPERFCGEGLLLCGFFKASREMLPGIGFETGVGFFGAGTGAAGAVWCAGLASTCECGFGCGFGCGF